MPAGSRPPFEYPSTPHHPEADQRRHKPPQWSDHRRYKEYLRDEFIFTCVYCLARESWLDSDFFGAEHFRPKSSHPELKGAYTNLLYVCNLCNTARGIEPLRDTWHPEAFPFGEHLSIDRNNGMVQAKTKKGTAIISALKLNREKLVKQRFKYITLYYEELLPAYNSSDPKRKYSARKCLRLLFGFPDPMFDLTQSQGAIRPYCSRDNRPEWY